MGNLNGKLSNGKSKRKNSKDRKGSSKDRKGSKSNLRGKQNKFNVINNHRKKPNSKNPQSSHPEELLIVQEDLELVRIKNDLYNNLEVFVLDNILMAIQFFENFERDVKWLRYNVSVSSETEKWNAKLSDQFKHAVSTSKLGDLVGKHVRFKHIHGEYKNFTEMLINPETLIVHDNVDVIDAPEGVSYSIVRDGKVYQFKMEYSSPGYMKLRSIINSPRSSFDHLRKKYLDQHQIEEATYDQLNGRGSPSSEESKISEESISYIRENRTPEPTPKLLNGNKKLNDDEEEEGEKSEENFIGEGSNLIQEVSNRLKLLNSPRVFMSDPNLTNEISTSTRKPSFRRKSFGPAKTLVQNTLQQPQSLTNTERKLSGILRPPKNTSLSLNKGPLKQMPILPRKSLKNPVEESEIQTPSSTDTDYGYTRVKKFATPQKLNERRLFCRQLLPGEWPRECFYKTTVKRLNNKLELFQTRYYADSCIFMRFFMDEFIEKVAESMDFVDICISDATAQGCDIFCNRIEKDSDRLTLRNKIIPSLFCAQWPRVANEFFKRNRNIIESNNGQTWPNFHLLDEILTYGCYLYPVGRMPSRGGNENFHLEWQVAFPKAERMLETSLSHEHLHIYLFTLVLYKRFLEPLNEDTLGLQTNHLKTLMFWQAEHCFDKWKENQLGKALIEFLNLIYRSLKKSMLPDFILTQRDLFESIPRGNLRKVQAFLFKIQENILMYVLQALRNIHYCDEFYPLLDFKRIYEIITIDNSLKLANPKLAGIVDEDQEENGDNDYINSDSEPEEENIFKEVQKHDPIRDWKRNVRRQIEAEKKKMRKQPRESASSVDSIQITVDINKKSDPIRRCTLLDLFIPHFIDMAKRSLVYRASNQANNYLTHAERLTRLLIEEDFSENKGSHYLKTISIIKETMVQPSTSKHNGLGPAPGIGPFREKILNNIEKIATNPVENLKKFTPENVKNTNVHGNAVSGRREASRISIKGKKDDDTLMSIKKNSYIINGPNYKNKHSVKVDIHNEDLAKEESSDL